jgi:CRP-like cAMP-binding protein
MNLAQRLLIGTDLRATDPTLVEALVACGEGMRAGAGTVLLTEGRRADTCFLLVEGGAELVHERPSGAVRLRVVAPGEMFGHECALRLVPQRWSAWVTAPSTLLRYERAALEAVLRGGGGLASVLLGRMVVSAARQLRGVNLRLSDALEVERAVSMTPPRVARVEVVSSAADEARHWRRPGR